MQAYFVSDIHLKTIDEPNAVILMNFLSEIIEDSKTTHLFFVGDIFDFWMADHQYFELKFQPIVDLCKKAIARGIELHFFEGNHDLNLKKFWQKKLGGKVYADWFYFQLGNKTVRVEHGDLINKDEKGYQRLRKFLRSRFILWASQAVPGFVVAAIGDNWSNASRSYGVKKRRDSAEEICDKIHLHAQEKIKERPFDLLVSGHVHVRDEFTFDWQGRKVDSVNLGTWLTRPCALVLNEEGQKFVELPAKGRMG